MEEWRDIAEHEGSYQVSSLGRVRSLDRVVRTSGHAPVRKQQGKMLSAADNGKGYSHIGLSKNGKTKTYRVCRLVATAFHGPCPEGMECSHLDGTRDNDTPENLQWVTPSENMSHTLIHGTDMRGTNHPSSKLTETDVVEIRHRYANGEMPCEIYKDYPVSKSTISSVTLGERWKHV